MSGHIDSKIADLETTLFKRFGLIPVTRCVKVRHCHCDIHTVSFQAEDDQENDPIVLIHGFGTGVAYWAPNIASLSKNHTVHCFDLPGFGRSSRPEFSCDETLAELEMVNCFEDWRKSMGIEKMYMIAHSFAAFFAASYALEHPHRISHLFLVDPWGFPEKPNLTQKQIDPQLYMHLISKIASYFNPFFLLRCTGSYASLVMKGLRPDVRDKFSVSGEPPSDVIYAYLAACNSKDPSGERLYKNLTNCSGFAKRPMCKRLYGLDESLATTFMYGSKTFIDPGPAFDLQLQRSHSVNVQMLRGAGHLVNVDAVNDFNHLILTAINSPTMRISQRNSN